MEHEFTSVPEYTKKAMFAVTSVTKMLKEGAANSDSTKGLTGSASIQLPCYDDNEPMELGAMTVHLNQMGKTQPPAEQPKHQSANTGRCY